MLTPTSSRLASRSVPRKASQANIGITAKTSGGAAENRKSTVVMPRVSTDWTSAFAAVRERRELRRLDEERQQDHQRGGVAAERRERGEHRVAAVRGPGGEPDPERRHGAPRATAAIRRDTSPWSRRPTRCLPSLRCRRQSTTTAHSVVVALKASATGTGVPRSDMTAATSRNAAPSNGIRRRSGAISSSPAVKPAAGQATATRPLAWTAPMANQVSRRWPAAATGRGAGARARRPDRPWGRQARRHCLSCGGLLTLDRRPLQYQGHQGSGTAESTDWRV